MSELKFQTQIVRALNKGPFIAATIRDSGDAGVPDIVAMHLPDGRTRWIEAKLEHTKVRPAQVEFLRRAWILHPKSSWWLVKHDDDLHIIPGFYDIRNRPMLENLEYLVIRSIDYFYVDWPAALVLV